MNLAIIAIVRKRYLNVRSSAPEAIATVWSIKKSFILKSLKWSTEIFKYLGVLKNVMSTQKHNYRAILSIVVERSKNCFQFKT